MPGSFAFWLELVAMGAPSPHPTMGIRALDTGLGHWLWGPTTCWVDPVSLPLALVSGRVDLVPGRGLGPLILAQLSGPWVFTTPGKA